MPMLWQFKLTAVSMSPILTALWQDQVEREVHLKSIGCKFVHDLGAKNLPNLKTFLW